MERIGYGDTESTESKCAPSKKRDSSLRRLRSE